MPFGRETRMFPSNIVLERGPGPERGSGPRREGGDLRVGIPVRSDAAYRQITC